MGWLQRFFYGRYGGDALNMTLLLGGLLWSFIWRFTPLWPVGYLSFVALGWALFRMLSRNVYKRRAENEKFLRLVRPVTGWFRTRSQRAKDQAHRYYACPACRQTCRVPRGRGKIEITCPKCGKKFVKKT